MEETKPIKLKNPIEIKMGVCDFCERVALVIPQRGMAGFCACAWCNLEENNEKTNTQISRIDF